jgi:hypothetical protein
VLRAVSGQLNAAAITDSGRSHRAFRRVAHVALLLVDSEVSGGLSAP